MRIGGAMELLAAIHDCGLVEPACLEEVARNLPDDDAGQLAQRLALRGLLSPYQIDQLLCGRGEELNLGPYRLLDLLGEGGMGQVFKAVQSNLNRVVALKVMRAEPARESPETVRRFQREARAAAQLSHPNIIGVFDSDVVGGRHYLAMEFVEGTDLARLVRQTGPLPVAHACSYIRQAALGLQHAHERGLIHRDIKPSNLLIQLRDSTVGSGSVPRAATSDANVEDRTVIRPRGLPAAGLPPPTALLKIVDLGLARQFDLGTGKSIDASLTETGMLMGTPDFIAPEQARDSHRVDIRADLYSLGCTFYFVLTGQAPFPDRTTVEKLLAHQLDSPRPISEFRSDVAAPIVGVLHKLMAKRPEERYQTPGDVAVALETIAKEGDKVATGKAANVATRFTQIVDVPDLPAAPAAAPERPSELNRRPAQKLVVLHGHRGWVTALAFGSNRRHLSSGGVDGAIRLWDLGRPRPHDVQLPHVHKGDIHALAYSPDCRLLASGPSTLDGLVWLWDLSREVPRDCAVLQAHQPVDALAFSPDGQTLAAGSGPLVRVWDLSGDRVRERTVFKGHTAAVQTLAFSPDGQILASAGQDGTVRLWNPTRKQRWGKDVNPILRHGEQVTTLQFSTDGRVLASGGLDQKVHLWDGHGTRFCTLDEHRGAIRAMQFPSQGNRLVVVDASGRVLCWDVLTGAKTFEWRLPRGLVATVALTVDGRFLATCNSDGHVLIFRLSEKDESRLSRTIAPASA